MAGEEEYRHLKGWIRRLAAIDPQTGLLNRHGAWAGRQFKRAVQGRKLVGIILASVDPFARLNDEPVGERIRKAVESSPVKVAGGSPVQPDGGLREC